MATARVSSAVREPLSVLHSRFAAPLRRFFQRYRLSAADVDDLTQEVFVRLAALGSQTALDRPDAFVFALARNLMRDRARRLYIKAVARSVDMDDADLSCERPTPEQWLELQQRLQLAEAALSSLKSSTREAFVLNRVHGNSYAETAACMAISVSMVEKHIMSAISALREANLR